MRKAVILFFLFVFISGCGNLAPTDSQVNGPEDSLETVQGGQTLIFRALGFTVTNKDGVALPDVEIEFFAGGTGILTNLNGNPLNPTSPGVFKTRTDDRGLARVSYLITLPSCPAPVAGTTTADQTATGSVRGTVGSNSGHLWKATITIKCS
ncbi:MAG: hypothetical protein ACE5FY_05155 [Nitrospiria bacterium]